jgi:hypothetical protein
MIKEDCERIAEKLRVLFSVEMSGFVFLSASSRALTQKPASIVGEFLREYITDVPVVDGQ